METGFADQTWNGTPYNPAWSYYIDGSARDVAAQARANDHDLFDIVGGHMCDCGITIKPNHNDTISYVSGSTFHPCRRRHPISHATHTQTGRRGKVQLERGQWARRNDDGMWEYRIAWDDGAVEWVPLSALELVR